MDSNQTTTPPSAPTPLVTAPPPPTGSPTPPSSPCYLINLVSIVLIIMGTIIFLAPVASDYHQRALVANVIPYLWSEAHRQGDDAPSQQEITEIRDELNKGTGLTSVYTEGCFVLGFAMIAAGFIPSVGFLMRSIKKG